MGSEAWQIQPDLGRGGVMASGCPTAAATAGWSFVSKDETVGWRVTENLKGS